MFSFILMQKAVEREIVCLRKVNDEERFVINFPVYRTKLILVRLYYSEEMEQYTCPGNKVHKFSTIFFSILENICDQMM